MKKRIIYTLALAVMLVMVLTACGGKDAKDENASGGKEVDVQTAADKILSDGDFKDQLATVDKSMALGRLYSLDEASVEAAAFYTNSNSTAEEIAVIKVNSADYVETVKAAYEKRISDQKEACKDYLPDEMPKLDSAVVYTNGNYVVLCISNDSGKANDVIKGLFE
ncbi:MAG: DUF4358 domain-containing protein [Clostridium sp.]|nr:DUF4358 domain-containing protein [Clostridium sp.]MCM1399598.1 DUF4358 domain-containing protein [Clostridium sp.]MCM1460152.1 DUF4358 domain-containing protein [Bacteroides sp.]